MLTFDFMRHAFVASTFIAITCGLIGVFVVARNMSFLAHTLAEIGFAGASFGVFLGIAPLNGMLLFTMLSSVTIGQMSAKESRREASISAISSLFIGLGILFLSLSNQNASYATNILFGSIIGISLADVYQLMALSAVIVIGILLFYRYLVFDSYDPIGAQAQGLKTNLISIYFLILLAISVSIAAQIVGSLLVFILVTLPAFIAKYLAKSVPAMLAISVGAALLGVWLGLWLGYITNWPVTFFIATIEFGFYFMALLYHRHVSR